MTALAFLGVRVSTYGMKTKFRTADETEREELFDNYLQSMKFNSPDPDFAEFLTPEQSDQVFARREEQKQAVVYNAAHSVNRDSFAGDEEFEKAVQRRDESISNLVEIGVPLETAEWMLIDYWSQKYSTPYQLRRGQWVYKDALIERLQNLRSIYGQ